MALDTKTDEAERDLRREALAAKSKDTTLGKDEGFWAKIGEMLASLLLSGGDKKETKEPDTLAYKGYTAPPEKGPQPELRMIVKPTLEPELKYIALAKPKEEPSPLLFTKAVPDSKVVPDPDYDAFRAQIDAAKQPEAPKETPKEAVSPPDPAKVKAADEAWKKLQDTESTQDKDAAARLQATREKLLSDAFPSPQPDSRPDKPAAQANANPDLKTFAAWQAAHQGVVDAQASFDVTKDRQDPESKKINASAQETLKKAQELETSLAAKLPKTRDELVNLDTALKAGPSYTDAEKDERQKLISDWVDKNRAANASAMPAPAGQPQPEKPASQELTDKEKKALLVYAAEVEAQDIQKRAGENPDGTPKMGADEAKKQADAKLEALQKADPQFVDKLMAYEKYPGGNPKWAQINDQVAVIREEKALEAQIERDKKALDAKVKYEDKVRDWAAADRKGKDEANKDPKIQALEAQLKEIDDARNADDAAKKAEKSTGETEKLLKGDTYNKDYDKEKTLATDAHGKATETAGLTETAREKRQALQQQIDELKKAHSKDADAKWKELHDLENANPDAAKDPGSYELKKKLEDLKAREVSEKPRFNDGILDVIGQQDELQKNKAAEKDGEKDKADAKDNKEPPHLKEARDAVPPDGHGINGGDHVPDHKLATDTGASPPPGKKPLEKSGLTPP